MQMGSHADSQHGAAAASTSQSCVQAVQQRLQPTKQCRGAGNGTYATQTGQHHVWSGSGLVSSCQRLTPQQVIILQGTRQHQVLRHRRLCVSLVAFVIAVLAREEAVFDSVE